MKIIIKVITFVGLFFIVQVKSTSPMTFNHLIDSSMVLLVEQNYQTAKDLIKKSLKKDPQNIDALYMQLTIIQTELLDYESYTLSGYQFFSLANDLIDLLKRKEKNSKSEQKAKILFYMGNVYGGKGLISAKIGKWMPAVSDALTSVSLLEKAKKLDPTLYAAYLGLGVFNYYLSQNLKWVPFLGDKTKEGIEAIETATKAKFPFNYAAQNTLAWILIEQNQYKRAETIVDEVLEDYPDNTIFLRIKARLALWTQRYEQGINIGNKLISISIKRDPVNWSDLLSATQLICECYLQQDKSELAKEFAQKTINRYEIPVNEMKIPYVKKYYAYINLLAEGKTD